MFTHVLYLSLLPLSSSGLSLPSDLPSSMVSHLQDRIFIETRRLAPLSSPCSSLAGPSCLPAFAGQTGVIPDLFLEGSPGFLEVMHSVPEEVWAANFTLLHLLLQDTPKGKEGGLQLSGGREGFRVGREFSRGLPPGILASWDGRWLVGESGENGAPAAVLSSHLPGYIRFSKPLLVRTLWLEAKEEGRVLVAMRRGLKTVWLSETIVGGGKTEEVTSRGGDGHAPLSDVDEIVIFSKGGQVKVVALELFEAHALMVPLLLLTPLPLPSSPGKGLGLKKVMVNVSALKNGNILSLKEAMTLGLLPSWPDLSTAREIGKVFPDREGGRRFLPPEAEMVVRGKVEEGGENDVFKSLLPFIAQQVVSGELAVPSELRKEVRKGLPQEKLIEILEEAKRKMKGEIEKLSSILPGGEGGGILPFRGYQEASEAELEGMRAVRSGDYVLEF